MGGRSADTEKRLAQVLDALPPHMSAKFAEAAGVFAPISALVRPSGGDLKRSCRIARSSLTPIWGWICDELEPDLARDVVRGWTATAVGASQADTQALVARLQKKGADAMLAALQSEDPKARDRLRARLGDGAGIGDAQDAAELIAHAADIDALFAAWPTKDSKVDGARVKALRKFCKHWARRAPRLGPLVAALAVERLEGPSDAADLLVRLVGRRDAKRLDETPFGVVIEGLIEDVVDRCAAGEGAVAGFEQAQSELTEIATAFEGRLQGPGRQRLSARRQAVATQFETTCDRAAELAFAMFAPLVDRTSEHEPAGAGEVVEAQTAARLLRDGRDLARSLGARACWEANYERVSQVVRVDVFNDWLLALSTLSGPARDRMVARLNPAIAVVRGFLGDGAAAFVEGQVQAAGGRPDLSTLVMKMLHPMIQWGDEPKAPGRIAVESLDRFWEWAREGVAGEAIAKAQKGLAAAETPGQRHRFEERLPAVRTAIGVEARDALERQSVEGTEEREQLLQRLGERGFADAREIAHVLAAARPIAAHTGEWPQRLREMNETRLTAFRSVFDKVTAKSPESGPFLLFYLLSRLEKPAQILRGLAWATRHDSDVAIEATDYGVIGDMLIDRAEALAHIFEASPHDGMNAEVMLDHLSEYAGIVSGMTEEFRIRQDGRWGRRLFALRARTARVLEMLCDRAVERVTEVTPKARAGRRGPEQANVVAPIDEAAWAQAAAYAQFVSGARAHDSRAAFAAAREKAVTSIRRRLDAQVESLVALAHDDDEETPALAIRHLKALEPVVRGFEGDDAADVILRRVAAAA